MGEWAIHQQRLEERLGYRFRRPELLCAALTHASVLPSGVVREAERLEFLGDAVLDLIIATMLIQAEPGWNEGQLSKQRSLLVRTSTLARKAGELGLGEMLILGRGEHSTGGRRKPSILAASYEAVIAAIFLDGGFARARAVVRREFARELASPNGDEDWKTMLQERCQASGGAAPRYEVVAVEGPAHARHFTVGVWVAGRQLGEGIGSSKRRAEQDAARTACGAISGGSVSTGSPAGAQG